MISDIDKAYAAGFFDGEGCISIGANGSVNTRIINTSKLVLENLQRNFGGSIGIRAQRVNKTQYTYSHYGENAIGFINILKPFMIEKLNQAETILEYYDLRNQLERISIPGRKGKFANPDRDLLVTVFREILSEQKKEEN